MPKSQEQESENRIDSIIALIMEEARAIKGPGSGTTRFTLTEAIWHVLTIVHARVMKIMRNME